MATEPRRVEITLSKLFILAAAVCLLLVAFTAMGWLALNVLALAATAGFFWLLSQIGL